MAEAVMQGPNCSSGVIQPSYLKRLHTFTHWRHWEQFGIQQDTSTRVGELGIKSVTPRLLVYLLYHLSLSLSHVGVSSEHLTLNPYMKYCNSVDNLSICWLNIGHCHTNPNREGVHCKFNFCIHPIKSQAWFTYKFSDYIVLYLHECFIFLNPQTNPTNEQLHMKKSVMLV